MPRPERAGLALALGATALALATRIPLLARTHALPTSNDDAIPLLMARHVLRGEFSTTLWNQPYNGALDAYLLAPGLLLLSPRAAFRAYEAICALLLVGAVAWLARRLEGNRAAVWAAVLAAVGTPYMALMAATGPTPNFLVPLLVAVPVLVGLSRIDAPRRGWVLPAVAGLVSGLAIWDSALALPSLAGAGAGLLAAGLRPRASPVAAYAGGLVAGASPLLLARAVGASAASAVTDLRPRWLWTDGLADLGHAVAGLAGLQVPLVVDGPERTALPLLAALLLGTGLALAAGAGAWSRRALPLLGWAGALCVAFALSRRTGADEVRYLYGLAVPLLALAGAGLARVARAKGPALAALLAAALFGPWALGHRALVHAWSDPTHAARVWEVPTLAPVLDTLERAHVRSAYASLQFAGRLTLESGGAVLASQAWNERVPGDPLRFRDEVDLDPAAAWVLSARLSRGMPRAGGFRELLAALGGGAREDLPGDFVVFRRFTPPFEESRAVPAAEITAAAADGTSLPTSVLDRDGATTWTSPLGLSPGAGLAARVASPRRLAALVLSVDLERSPLAVPWIVEVDGATVAAGPARHGLQWVNGVPRAGAQALLTVPLPARGPVTEVRILFQEAGPPLVVGEVFLYGPDEAAVPDAGAAAAERGLTHARDGQWRAAAESYAEAVRLAPERASHHASLARARWRAERRTRLDVESLPDGGALLVVPRAGR